MSNVEPLRPTRSNVALRRALDDREIARRDLVARLYRIADAIDRGTTLDLFEAADALRRAAQSAEMMAVSVQ